MTAGSTYRLRKLISARRRVFGNIGRKNISKESLDALVWPVDVFWGGKRSGNTACWLSANPVRIWVKLTSIPRRGSEILHHSPCIRICKRGRWSGCEWNELFLPRSTAALVGGVPLLLPPDTGCTLSEWRTSS